MATKPTAKETPTGDGNSTAGEAIKHRDCPTGHPPDKAIENFRVAYALRRNELYGTDPADGSVLDLAERRELVRQSLALHGAALFSAQIAGRL